MRLLVGVLLLLATLPPPAQAAASWSVDGSVAVFSEDKAELALKLTGITNTNLSLPRPANATLAGASDARGSLSVSNFTRDGRPWVTVLIRQDPATVRFTLDIERDGPFRSVVAQIPADEASPTSVGISLPPGWTISGYRCTVDLVDCATPSSTGTFRETGPVFAEFLLLPSGLPDPGPDPFVHGDGIRREGFANVTATSTHWTLITTYDTDKYGREWEVHVPDGATNVRATSPYGALTTRPEGDGIVVHSPYPFAYGLGGRSFTVEMDLPPAEAHGGAFLLQNVSIRAGEGDDIRIDASIPANARYAGARVSGGEEVAPLRYRAQGPLSVGFAFLPPAAPGHVQFDEGLFVVDAPASLAQAARATARNTSDLLPHVASFAYAAADDKPFYVAYTDADIFHWEEGFYSNELNTITIRASTLANATDGAAHLVPVSILAHEATHGLIDRALPDAPHNLSFLHEGLSRLTETRTELHFPDEVLACREELLTRHCDRHSARPGAEELRDRYLAGASFNVSWKATDVSDDARGDLYDYSGLVLHAYSLNAPPGALENALLHIARTRFPGVDAEDASILMDILLANAPGTGAQALLYPGAQAASLPIEQFRYCLRDLVAPPYDWESARAPADGCPSMGYGARDAPLPTPPSAQVTPPPPTSASPVTAPPKISPPQTSPEGSEATRPPPGDAGEVPGAMVEPAPAGRAPVQVEVPGAPLAAGLAAVALLALALRRR